MRFLTTSLTVAAFAKVMCKLAKFATKHAAQQHIETGTVLTLANARPAMYDRVAALVELNVATEGVQLVAKPSRGRLP